MEESKTQSYSHNNEDFKSFSFEGNAKEYFRIWIVNIALTLLTLGIYSAWAKVRANRYVYANTYLNGSNFEYNADPIRILIGRIIVITIYIAFIIFSKELYMVKVAAGIAFLAFALMPWLIRQAVSFKLRNTSYRHVPFRYTGKTSEFYAFFLLHSLLNIFTLFLAFPFSYVRFKELVIRNSHYGQGNFFFEGKVKTVYEIYFSIIGWTVLFFFMLLIILGIFSAIFTQMNETFDITTFLSTFDLDNQVITSIIGLATLILIYPFIFAQKALSDAYFSNYVRNNTCLENARLKGDIDNFKLAWIAITNVFAVIFSLGLLYPWSKIRYLKYKIEQTFINCYDYDQFESHGYEKGSTVGEEMIDFFDIDIGL